MLFVLNPEKRKLDFSDRKREIQTYMAKTMIPSEYHVVVLINKQFIYK